MLFSPALADVERIAALDQPVIRNLQITQCYHELARAFAARLPGAANWCAFAAWASKQAGQTIRGEDLRRHFEHAVDASLQTRGLGEEIVTIALATGARLSAQEIRGLLRRSLNAEAALERAGRAVARGNLKVFAEIAPAFARFTAERLPDTARDADALHAFIDGLEPGDPPAGQGYLRRAFTHYYEALLAHDAKARAELIFLGNLEVGFHEQTRLQPDIRAALDFALPEPRRVTDQLIAALLPGAGWLVRLRLRMKRMLRGPTPLERAVAALLSEVERRMREIMTEHLLTLGLAGGARLGLGRDLPGAFPESLARISNTELAELLRRIDPTPDSRLRSGAADWADLPERMHFICDFFRCHHERPDLFDPPFTVAQTAALKSGALPPGPL